MADMILYGPDGKKLHARLGPRGCDDMRVAINKARVEAWLAQVVGPGDRAGKRNEGNWQRSPRKCLTQGMVDALRARGIAIYLTDGQFVAADLTGGNPRVRQCRPLAERYIELVEDGNDSRMMR